MNNKQKLKKKKKRGNIHIQKVMFSVHSFGYAEKTLNILVPFHFLNNIQ
jgi:hypothetical protein